MSIPPTASRLLRWQDRHPVLTDSAVALLLLVFTCVIGFSQTSPFPLRSWAPASLAAMVPATAGLCLRRRRPMIAWTAVDIIDRCYRVHGNTGTVLMLDNIKSMI